MLVVLLSAAGLTGKTKLMTDAALNFGVDALISGTSDTTSEAGNLATLMESGIQKIYLVCLFLGRLVMVNHLM